MKHLRQFITEVSSELAKRAAKKQSQKLALDFDKLSDEDIERMIKRIEKFNNYKEGQFIKKVCKNINIPISDDMKACIRHGMEYGYVDQEEKDSSGNIIKVRYGISRENIIDVFTAEGDIDAEMLETLISKFEDDGVKFKFDKNIEWKNKGYADPM